MSGRVSPEAGTFLRTSLVPYPRRVRFFEGRVTFTSSPEVEIPAEPDSKERLSAEQVQIRFQELGVVKGEVLVRLGSLETVRDPGLVNRWGGAS